MDELHLMMRVADHLTENLIVEVMERDSNADVAKGRGEKKAYTWRLSSTLLKILGPLSLSGKRRMPMERGVDPMSVIV